MLVLYFLEQPGVMSVVEEDLPLELKGCQLPPCPQMDLPRLEAAVAREAADTSAATTTKRVHREKSSFRNTPNMFSQPPNVCVFLVYTLVYIGVPASHILVILYRKCSYALRPIGFP